MPNRKTHGHLTTILALTEAVFIGPIDAGVALALSGGTMLGVWIHPDMDQTDTLYGQTHRHRGLSHWPIIGTLERAVWVFGLIALADWIMGFSLWPLAGWCLVGLCTADILHIIADKLWRATD